ncbi:MAG: glycosyltransferase family 8 protein [Alphaproteobacteria bacterium]|nr:glycosyltransferase family 8 protein [Alphaproteobacteria bacterium]
MIPSPTSLQNPQLIQPPPARGERPLATIAFSTDQAYLPFVGVAIASILRHADPAFEFSFFILHDGLSRPSIEHFRLLGGGALNPQKLQAKIMFVDCRGEMPWLQQGTKALSLAPAHRHVPAENITRAQVPHSVMYRLLLPTIMQHYERVLYLDADVIAGGDITPLFTMPLNGAALAAVRDLPVYANCVAKIAVPLANGAAMPWKDYFATYLDMGDNWQDYFNAGVLLFDMQKIASLQVIDDILQAAPRGYIYADQDVLNKYLSHHCLLLSAGWNLHTFLQTPLFEQHVKRYVEPSLVADYVAAHQQPRIIHFAGPWKPWKRTDIVHTDRFFSALLPTPWADEIMTRFALDKKYRIISQPATQQSAKG